MIRIRSGVVQGRVDERAGALELTVVLADGVAVRALAYPDLVGSPAVGERVLVNVTALERGLGTGGWRWSRPCPIERTTTSRPAPLPGRRGTW